MQNLGNLERTGTQVHELGIVIAPTNLVMQEPVVLYNGKTIPAGAEYFTWETVKEVVERTAPEGWRLPKREESVALQARYGKSRFGQLVFGSGGYLAPEAMHLYNYVLDLKLPGMLHDELTGYFWTDSSANERFAYAIKTPYTGGIVSEVANARFGFKAVLVKDL